MKKNVTKLIENFGLKLENNTFVIGIVDQFHKVNTRIAPYADKFNKDAYFFLCKTRTKAKRSYKYVFGKIRLREFMIESIHRFDKEHSAMVSIIEEGKLSDDKKSKEYADHKQRIAIILRANKRISGKRITNDELVKSYINRYIHNSRMDKNKYSLAT